MQSRVENSLLCPFAFLLFRSFALSLFRSKSLSLKSDVSDLLVLWEPIAFSFFCSQKTSNLLLIIRCFLHVFTAFPLFIPFYAKEQITLVALKTRATRAICSLKRANHYFALLLTINEQFARKTKEQIPNPGAKQLNLL